jgi:hypothetical protein
MNIVYGIAGDGVAVGIPEIDAVPRAAGYGVVAIGIAGTIAAPYARPAAADVLSLMVLPLADSPEALLLVTMMPA